MNIETKEVHTSSTKSMRVYSLFGWEVTRTVTKHRRHYTILSRDLIMPHYHELCELERQYDEAAAQKKYYEQPDVVVYLILFLLFIVPGILFCIYQKQKKEEIDAHNAELNNKMDSILHRAELLRANVNQ